MYLLLNVLQYNITNWNTTERIGMQQNESECMITNWNSRERIGIQEN